MGTGGGRWQFVEESAERMVMGQVWHQSGFWRNRWLHRIQGTGGAGRKFAGTVTCPCS